MTEKKDFWSGIIAEEDYKKLEPMLTKAGKLRFYKMLTNDCDSDTRMSIDAYGLLERANKGRKELGRPARKKMFERFANWMNGKQPSGPYEDE